MTDREKKLREIAKSWPQDTPEEQEKNEKLIQAISALTDDECILLGDILDQDKRANALGLRLDIDTSTNTFFLADMATNAVIAPPPMNLATVTAWLDDYEQEAAE